MNEVDSLLRKLIRQSSGVVNECAGMSDRLVGHLFDLQQEIISDPSEFKMLCAGRRGSKTYIAATALARKATETTDTEVIYLATSKSSAKSIIWEDLKKLLSENGIDYTTNAVECTITLKNKSRILIDGVFNRRDCERLRGKRFPLIWIDEAAFFPAHLDYLIYEVLRPQMADYEGSQLVLSSSPNASCTGLFHDEWHNTDSLFKKWFWDVRHNECLPRWRGKSNWKEIAKQYFEEVRQEYAAKNRETQFEREWAGKWLRDVEALCLPELKTYSSHPENLIYYIGIDLGFSPDPVAIVVVGVSTMDYIPKAYIAHTFQQHEMLTSDLARHIKKLNEVYQPVAICMDPGAGGTRTLADINNLYNLNIENAQKPQGRKALDIDLIRDLFATERMFISESEKEAIDELGKAQWNEQRTDVDNRFANHRMDALIYAFRMMMHLFPENPDKAPAKPYDELKDYWKEHLVKKIAQNQYEEELLYGNQDMYEM